MNISTFQTFLQAVYRKGLHQVSRVQRDGTNVFAESWDLLIVLDACRYDLFAEVARDRSLDVVLDSRWSVDSMTREWMTRTFVERFAAQQERTRYVCGNPFSSEAIDATRLATLEEVWRHHWDDTHGTLLPRPLTDRVIDYGRSADRQAERVIVHYMQPHWPFLDAPEIESDTGWDIDNFVDGTDDYHAWENNPDDVWERLRRGDIDRDTAWQAYRRNLHRVLDDVDILLENYDAETVIITSDHGNALGEWGIYGHPMHMPFECLRKVPWAETTATDEHTHEPDPANLQAAEVDNGVTDRLRQLGYTE